MITDRVHNVSDILPGVAVGPKFWDHDTGDTLVGGKFKHVTQGSRV